MVDELNENLPTLYPTRCHRRQQPIQPPIVLDTTEHGPPEHMPYNIDDTALAQINIRNLLDNIDLTLRTRLPAVPNQETIPHVTENVEPIAMARHFPQLRPLQTTISNDLQMKTRRDVPHQKVINKMIDQLNSKTMHFYNLPFAFRHFKKK